MKGGRAPRLKQRVKAMLNRKTALELVGAGETVANTARQLGITVQSVRRLLRQALATESLFPASLTPERIAELRQLEGEKLTFVWQKLHESFEATPAEQGTARARLAEASARVSERLAAMFGLNAPVKVIEQQLRVSYEKTESKITISFDRSPIEALARVPVPGLTITAGAELKGQTPLPALEPGAVSRAGLGPPADFEPIANGEIAGGESNPAKSAVNDFREESP